MERKEAYRYINSKLQDGMSKSELYKELLPQMVFKDELVSCLAILPDKDARNRNRNRNLILSAMIVFGMLLFFTFLAIYAMRNGFLATVIEFDSLLAPILMQFFSLYCMRKYDYNGYVAMLFIGILFIGNIPSCNMYFVDRIVIAMPIAASMVLSYKIKNDMFPYRKMFKSFDQGKFELALVEDKL